MSLIPFILLFIALLLIFIEFFLPGGVLATVAGIMLLASIVFFALNSSSILWTLLYVVFVAFIVVLLIQFTIRRIRKGKFKGIYLHTAQEGYVASEYAKELIGKTGEAVSDLKPAGHILIEGKRFQAVSKVGYIEKGEPIAVVGGEGAHLIVKRLQEKKET